MSEPIKVYVSYSWNVESKTGIVKKLKTLCKARGIELVQDETTLQHKDRISRFMDQIANAEHVITVFSAEYFKSEYCMYELLTIQDRGDFDQRIHPVLADGLELYKPRTRRDFIRHWNDFVADEEEAIEGLGAGVAPDQHEKLNFYQQIELRVSGIMASVGDMVITPLDKLEAAEFAPLLDNIAPLVNQHAHQSRVPDSDFLAQVKAEITHELEPEALAEFRAVLKTELDRLLQDLGEPAIADNQPALITEGLIVVLQQGGSRVPVITSALMNAAMHCFDRRKGRYYQTTRARHPDIQYAIEQLLGWLVLASVNDQFVAQLRSSTELASAVYFELPVMTTGGVEIIVSRNYQRAANLVMQESDISSRHVLHTQSTQYDWKKSETTEQLKMLVWNQVFPDKKKNAQKAEYLTAKEVGKLNSEIEIRRSDTWQPEHYIMAVECSGQLGMGEADKSTYESLFSELNQLTLVRFGVSGQQAVFYTPEYQLINAISRFLTNINRTLNQ